MHLEWTEEAWVQIQLVLSELDLLPWQAVALYMGDSKKVKVFQSSSHDLSTIIISGYMHIQGFIVGFLQWLGNDLIIYNNNQAFK
jgi:hypothetical protein